MGKAVSRITRSYHRKSALSDEFVKEFVARVRCICEGQVTARRVVAAQLLHSKPTEVFFRRDEPQRVSLVVV